MQKSEINRFTKVLSVLLLIFTLYSSFFIAHEMHHHCSGEYDCPVCCLIQIACQNLKLLSFALSAVILLHTFKSFHCHNIQYSVKSVFKSNTLISQKTRIND